MKRSPLCYQCGKKFKGTHVHFFVIYDKCHGKTCPDCGKVRRLSSIKVVDGGGVSSWKCLRCNEMIDVFVSRQGNEKQGCCEKCFLEREGKDGCICYSTKSLHFCSICDEVHAQPKICQECTKKQTTRYKNTQTFLRIILPTSVISLIIGFFLGWLLLVKLRRKKGKT